MRFPGAVRATGVGPQLQGGASGVCKTRGSHGAVAGGLGKGLAGKSATQRATEVAAGGFPVAVGCHRTIELTRVAFGMPPRAMTAQFSNSNGGMTRSFSTVHGRSRTTKPRPARQSGSLSGRGQTSCRRLAITHRHGRNINAHPGAQIFKEPADDFPSPLPA